MYLYQIDHFASRKKSHSEKTRDIYFIQFCAQTHNSLPAKALQALIAAGIRQERRGSSYLLILKRLYVSKTGGAPCKKNALKFSFFCLFGIAKKAYFDYTKHT
jgi:hypothetical protein